MSKFNPKRNPDKLPYRPIGEVYLLYKNKLVAQDAGHYLSLPGGGIDKGESPIKGATRELMEEIGAKLDGKLEIISEMTWDWNPEWADNPKRKKRYMQFRGERVYSMFGVVKEFVKPTSNEGNAWVGTKFMSLNKASKLMEKMFKQNNPSNQYAYNLTKLNIISLLNSINNKKLLKTKK